MAPAIDSKNIATTSDWLRFFWPFPKYKSKKFMDRLTSADITLAAFRKLPVYLSAVNRGLITKDKWSGPKKWSPADQHVEL